MAEQQARGRWTACGSKMLTLLCALASPGAWADTPSLQCQVRYLSESVLIDAQPTTRPYEVASHDIAGRFRFKAVVTGEGGQVESVALYAYDMSVPNAPVLIHEVVFKPPFVFDRPVPALTGWNHVYSARLGREMVYGCALRARAAGQEGR